MGPIGFVEIFLIGFVVLVFVRPEDLPAFFRKIGKVYGELQQYYYKIKTYSRDTFDEISRLDLEEEKIEKDPYSSGYEDTFEDSPDYTKPYGYTPDPDTFSETQEPEVEEVEDPERRFTGRIYGL